KDIREAVSSLAEEVNTGETNIGGALQSFLARAESSAVVLLSDGFETSGDARQAARAAAAKGVRIFPLLPDESAFRAAELSISGLDAPITLNAGEVGEIRASVRNSFPADRRGTVEIWMDDKRLASQSVVIPGGEERLVFVKTPVLEGGLHRIRANVTPEG